MAEAAAPPRRQALFSFFSDDIVLNILDKLEADPRDWARLSCVSTRFASLIASYCFRSKCPSSVSDLVAALSPAAADWSSLFKLTVCCPGLHHAGILLENSDFGLEREIGPDESYRLNPSSSSSSSSSDADAATSAPPEPPGCWSLFDDLYFDTVYDESEAQLPAPVVEIDQEPVRPGEESIKKWVGPVKPHLASGARNLSREQGVKLLGSRFRGDSLYISDWPGCVHEEKKRKYMLFRGMFMNFNKSRVWRTINDLRRAKSGLDCAFCGCRETWDLHSAFCLRWMHGFHDDGDPVVRAYVCEKGHVSGAWTERPMYT